MSGYYNILPTILIDIFIILLFEGLVFFLYLIKQEEQIISNQFNKFLLNIRKKEEQITNPVKKQLIETARQQLNTYIPTAMKKEQTDIETSYRNGLII